MVNGDFKLPAAEVLRTRTQCALMMILHVIRSGGGDTGEKVMTGVYSRPLTERTSPRAKYRPNTHISYLTRGPSGCSICASSIAAVSSCCSSNRRADKGAGYAKCRQYTPNHLCVNPSVRLGDLFNTDAVNSLSSEPSGPAHAPARSGRQSSVSTNNHPGESENVRLLLRKCQQTSQNPGHAHPRVERAYLTS